MNNRLKKDQNHIRSNLVLINKKYEIKKLVGRYIFCRISFNYFQTEMLNEKQ